MKLEKIILATETKISAHVLPSYTYAAPVLFSSKYFVAGRDFKPLTNLQPTLPFHYLYFFVLDMFTCT